MPGLVTTGTSGSESDDDEDDDEETPSMYCLTCKGICGCTINISSSSDEPLVVGEASTPSSALRRGKKKLEHLLDKEVGFTHEVWKYGRIAQPNQLDSEDDDDSNVPFDWKALSHSERKKRLCADLHLNDNPILDAEPAQKSRLQDLVANYSDIFYRWHVL